MKTGATPAEIENVILPIQENFNRVFKLA